MQEICSTSAPGATYCDCRPAWQCPHQAPQARPCRLPGHGHRYGYSPRLGVCCQQQVAPVLPGIGPVSSVEPSAVAREQLTTRFTLGFTTATTTTTTTPPPSTTPAPAPSRCRPLALCPEAAVEPALFVTCQLADGALGVLCDDQFRAEFAASARGLGAEPRAPRALSADQLISEEFVLAAGAGEAPRPVLVEAALTEATQAVRSQAEQEAALPAPPGDSSVAIFNMNFQSDLQQQQLGRQGLQQLLAV